MRRQYTQQLGMLHDMLTEMGAMCEAAIGYAVEAIEKGDASIAKRAWEIDQNIDKMERDIEALCMKLLLQQQPVARDLRLISAALKMITDMERVGDQTADIYEILRTGGPGATGAAPHIVDMANEASAMVRDSITAFISQNLTLVREVIARDDIVDSLFIHVRDDLAEWISRNPARGAQAVDTIMVAKYLERIGDHAVNIAEWVEYSITGTHPRGEAD